MADAFGALVAAVWIYLLLGRGAFWRARMLATRQPQTPCPPVAVVVPARNEAEHIEVCIEALLQQDYLGPFKIILVDDNSTDGTADRIRNLQGERVSVLRGKDLPPGWTGKLWALQQGVDAASEAGTDAAPKYLLFTDADIVHAPNSLTQLVSHAEADKLTLLSLMAKLRCRSLAERSHVPAFVFFFQMLYPFSWVGRPDRATAAAAGGCMLVRRDALALSGGLRNIRNELIDDCAMARQLKPHGAIALALTETVDSLRAYETLSDVSAMISRCAYAQLRYSPSLLVATLVAMSCVFLAPPLLAIFGSGLARGCGALAWGLMALMFQPTLRLYRLSPIWGLALPLIAMSYAAFTVQSALHHRRGRGGEWKGRTHCVPT